MNIKCVTCDGHGIVDAGYHNPEECKECGGSGHQWKYESGAIAKYPGGPFVCGASKSKPANHLT